MFFLFTFTTMLAVMLMVMMMMTTMVMPMFGFMTVGMSTTMPSNTRIHDFDLASV